MKPPYSSLSTDNSAAHGFTLIELLGVIAVMLLILGMSAPLIGNLREASQTNRVALELSAFMEQAGAYALANNTHVWVGFHEDVARQRMVVAAVAGITGAATDIEETATYRLINNLRRYENLALSAVVGLPGMAVADEIDDSTLPSFTVEIGSESISFEKVIGFSPGGSAKIDPQLISRWIQIGLIPMRGSTPNNDNVTAIQIGGLTGNVRVFRP